MGVLCLTLIKSVPIFTVAMARWVSYVVGLQLSVSQRRLLNCEQEPLPAAGAGNSEQVYHPSAT